MTVTQSAKLMELYAACPECGCAVIGNGKGTLECDTGAGYFKRACSCGWYVEVREVMAAPAAPEPVEEDPPVEEPSIESDPPIEEPTPVMEEIPLPQVEETPPALEGLCAYPMRGLPQGNDHLLEDAYNQLYLQGMRA